MSGYLILAALILAVILLLGVGQYNRLVRLRNDISNAYAQIDVQLKRRYDLIPNLVEVAKKYLAHESQTLEAVIKARNEAAQANQSMQASPMRAARAQQLSGAELHLDTSLGKLFAIAESYPNLKADATMRELSDELTSTENKVGFSRQAYNDAVLEYNNAAQEFPAAIVARACGFEQAAMLQSTQSAPEREAVRVQF